MSWILAGALVLGMLASYYLQSRIKMPEQKWQVPTAQDGVVRPVVFGTVRLQRPNIIWFGDKRKQDEHFSATVHYDLCHGKLDKLLRVIVGDRVAYDGELDGEDYCFAHAVFDGVYGYAYGDPANGDYVQGVTDFWPGTIDDTPGANPGSSTGWRGILARLQGLTDNTGPSYAGRATLLCQWDLGKTPALKPVAVDVQRIHTRDGGASAQWYDAKAEITVGWNREDDWKWLVVGPDDSTDRSGIAYDDSGFATGPGGFGNAPAENYHSSREEDDKESGPTQGYDTPPVRTNVISSAPTLFSGDSTATTVTAGTQIWVRKDLGAMQPQPLGVMCWHDDTAELWFNGTPVTLEPIYSPTDPDYIKFHSKATVPASLVDADGPNVVAYKVTDSGDLMVTTTQPGRVSVGRAGADGRPPLETTGDQIEKGDYIYAGIQIGPNLREPRKDVAMNPIHIIREALTDTIWGAGRAEAKMGDSFTTAADTCYEEGLGISYEWRGEEGGGTVIEFIAEILRHIVGVLYLDRFTGKYEIKLIREDYVVGTLPVFDDDTIEAIEDASRPAMGDLVNSISVSYRGSLSGDMDTATVFEPGSITAQGMKTAKIDYPGLTTQLNAHRAAMRDLRVGASPFLSCRATMSRHAASLQPGSAVVVDQPRLGMDELVMRVRGISLGDGRDGRCKVELAEDVFYSPAPETLVVPAGAPTGTVKLGPLAVTQSKWITTQVIDPLNRGSVLCVFGLQTGMDDLFAEFTETEPGVFVRDTLGALPAYWYDGVDFEVSNPDNRAQNFVGRTVFAFRGAGTNYPERTGPWMLKDVGGYWTDVPVPGTFVNTYVTLARPPGYQYGSQYVQGMTFRVLKGDTYGGTYFTLTNESVTLGVTALSWDLADTYSWSTAYRLLTEPQLVTEAAPIDQIELSETIADGSADFDGFPMLPLACQQDRLIPAYWEAQIEAARLTADDPAATTYLGVKVYRSSAVPGVSGLLFEMLGADFHSESDIPVRVKGWYEGCKLEPEDVLVMIPTLHSTSVGGVEMTIRINSPARQTYLLAPFRAPQTAQSQRIVHASVQADGVLTVPEGASIADVTVAPGTQIAAIDRPNSASGDRLAVTVRGGNGDYGDRIIFVHQGAATGRQSALWINGDAEDLEITAAVARFEMMYSATDDYWHLLPGGVMT